VSWLGKASLLFLFFAFCTDSIVRLWSVPSICSAEARWGVDMYSLFSSFRDSTKGESVLVTKPWDPRAWELTVLAARALAWAIPTTVVSQKAG